MAARTKLLSRRTFLRGAGVALGLLGRAAPSLQLLALAMPIRAALGLALVLLGLATLGATLAGSWSSWPGGL